MIRRQQEQASTATRNKPQVDVPRGFTTVELLVSIGVLTAVAVAVSSIFTISTEAARATAGHVEILEVSSAVHQELANEISHMVPGLLIIESPPALSARAEAPGGPKILRLRQDRLVFIAAGDSGHYQSFTDPRRGTPLAPMGSPASSSQALVYWGPGLPLDGGGVTRPLNDANLIASELSLLRRRILLLLSAPTAPPWIVPDMSIFTGGAGMLNGAVLPASFVNAEMDAVQSEGPPGMRASADTLIEQIDSKNIATLLAANPPIAALWEPSAAIGKASLADPLAASYYTKTGFQFQPHLADVRIEWTDGRRVSATDFGTRWFGLKPDSTQDVDPFSPDDTTYVAIRRQDMAIETTAGELVDYANRVEWSATGNSSDVNAAYRAVWRSDTWHLRPKALRITYRIYDAGLRVKEKAALDLDEDGVPEPEGSAVAPRTVARYGQEFSVIVELP
jgi:hypothetical protein